MKKVCGRWKIYAKNKRGRKRVTNSIPSQAIELNTLEIGMNCGINFIDIGMGFFFTFGVVHYTPWSLFVKKEEGIRSVSERGWRA